jgi:hypothetical protein
VVHFAFLSASRAFRKFRFTARFAGARGGRGEEIQSNFDEFVFDARESDQKSTMRFCWIGFLCGLGVLCDEKSELER